MHEIVVNYKFKIAVTKIGKLIVRLGGFYFLALFTVGYVEGIVHFVYLKCLNKQYFQNCYLRNNRNRCSPVANIKQRQQRLINANVYCNIIGIK